MVDTIRLQYPSKRQGLFSAGRLELTDEHVQDVVEEGSDRLLRLVEQGTIDGRVRIDGGEITRTTAGPAISLDVTGQVNESMLQALQITGSAVVGEQVTEVLAD